MKLYGEARRQMINKDRNKAKSDMDKETLSPGHRNDASVAAKSVIYREKKVAEKKEKCWEEFKQKIEDDCLGNKAIIYSDIAVTSRKPLNP